VVLEASTLHIALTFEGVQGVPVDRPHRVGGGGTIDCGSSIRVFSPRTALRRTRTADIQLCWPSVFYQNVCLPARRRMLFGCYNDRLGSEHVLVSV
jgi:hypothetical protein